MWYNNIEKCVTSQIDEKSTPGAYLLKHTPSKKVFVGSTGDLRKTIALIAERLKAGIFHTEEVQYRYNVDKAFQVKVFRTDTVTEAFEIEQALLDKGQSVGNLLNSRRNAVGDMYNDAVGDYSAKVKERKPLAQSTKDKIGVANKGRVTGVRAKALIGLRSKERLLTPEHQAKLQAGMKASPAFDLLKRRMAELGKAKCKKVRVEGTVYNSLNDAASQLGVSNTTVANRIKSTSEKYKGWAFVGEKP